MENSLKLSDVVLGAKFKCKQKYSRPPMRAVTFNKDEIYECVRPGHITSLSGSQIPIEDDSFLNEYFESVN